MITESKQNRTTLDNDKKYDKLDWYEIVKKETQNKNVKNKSRAHKRKYTDDQFKNIKKNPERKIT